MEMCCLGDASGFEILLIVPNSVATTDGAHGLALELILRRPGCTARSCIGKDCLIAQR